MASCHAVPTCLDTLTIQEQANVSCSTTPDVTATETILTQRVIAKTLVKKSVCDLPIDSGSLGHMSCLADIPKYAYNSGTGECELFYYTGCHGNGNNFMTKSDCENACKKKYL